MKNNAIGELGSAINELSRLIGQIDEAVQRVDADSLAHVYLLEARGLMIEKMGSAHRWKDMLEDIDGPRTGGWQVGRPSGRDRSDRQTQAEEAQGA